MRWLCAVVLTSVVLAGCHTMRFELSYASHSEPVYERKSFFLWGLAPTREVDVSEFCPHGAAAVKEETRFSDGLLSFVTLGIWSPRFSWYYCLEGDRQ